MEVKEEDIPLENEPTERRIDHKTMVITEVNKDLSFFAQDCEKGELKLTRPNTIDHNGRLILRYLLYRESMFFVVETLYLFNF